jgi:acyl-CoA synthetase (NDP forming)
MNSNFRNDNSSGIKGVNFHKKSNKWQAEINIDGIKIYLGTYDTIEQATQARVQRAKKAFGQYVSAYEGVNHGAKKMKIQKPKTVVVQPIIKHDIQQIYNIIVKLNNALKVVELYL